MMMMTANKKKVWEAPVPGQGVSMGAAVLPAPITFPLLANLILQRVNSEAGFFDSPVDGLVGFPHPTSLRRRTPAPQQA